MAISETYTDKNGQKVDKACFVDVVFWDKQADVCKNYLTKGSPLLVEGRLQMDEWTSKEGEKRSKLRVRGERLQLLGSKREPGAAPAGRAPGRPAEDDGRPAEDLGEPAAAPADGDTPF
jgi:single-strand DNA-binding protein